MRIWLRLWWHNNVKRHYWNWWVRRYLYREWIAEGRDPRFFPKSGKITSKEERTFRERIGSVRLTHKTTHKPNAASGEQMRYGADN